MLQIADLPPDDGTCTCWDKKASQNGHDDNFLVDHHLHHQLCGGVHQYRTDRSHGEHHAGATAPVVTDLPKLIEASWIGDIYFTTDDS